MLPLLDVLFMLLVFLLLTAHALPKMLQIDLPATDDNIAYHQPKENNVMIGITNKQWHLNNKNFVNFTDFRQDLLDTVNKNPQGAIIIASDANASVENLLKVLTLLNSQGLTAAEILLDNNLKK